MVFEIASTNTERGEGMQLHLQRKISTGFSHYYILDKLEAKFIGGKNSQEKERTYLSTNDIFMAKDHTYHNNGKGFVTKIYGGIKSDVLSLNWKDDHHL